MSDTLTTLALLLVLISTNATSQSQLKRVELNEEMGSVYLSDHKQAEYYFDLKPIESSKYEYHFRYIKSSQVIELFSNDAKTFKGEIINFIQEEGKKDKPTNYLFEKINVSAADASLVGQYFIDSKVYNIPTDSLIPNWNFRIFDCGSINFKYKVKNDIMNAVYSCVQGQNESVKNVLNILKFRDTIANSLKLKKSWEDFKNKLPKGKSYRIDGWITMYILTDKQLTLREKNKPVRDYQKSIKDTIDNYLENKLNELIPNSTELDCFDDYLLVFNKHGRLKKMTVDMSFWERLSDRDYRLCRKILKNAFKDIRIDFIDPKYSFYRRLRFGSKKISISDPTIY